MPESTSIVSILGRIFSYLVLVQWNGLSILIRRAVGFMVLIDQTYLEKYITN